MAVLLCVCLFRHVFRLHFCRLKSTASNVPPPPRAATPSSHSTSTTSRILTCNQNGVTMLLHVDWVTWVNIYTYIYLFIFMHKYLCVRVSRFGSRTDAPKRDAWSSWARWAHGDTHFSGVRGGWERWWTGSSLGSSSLTGPSRTTEV